jgi:hypothetical protein
MIIVLFIDLFSLGYVLPYYAIERDCRFNPDLFLYTNINILQWYLTVRLLKIRLYPPIKTFKTWADSENKPGPNMPIKKPVKRPTYRIT